MRRGDCAALALTLAMLAACGPALEWREIRPAAEGLRASFPCRPDKQTRQVPLAGASVALTLYVCKAGGATFALSHADMGDPARVASALQALRASAEATLGTAAASAGGGVASGPGSQGAAWQGPGSQGVAWQVPGMTPQPASGRWSLQGRQPDGSALRVELAVFSRGTQVVQAMLLAPEADDARMRTFFEGLRFAP